MNKNFNKLPKIALGAWAWGNDGTFGNDWTSEDLRPIFDAAFRNVQPCLGCEHCHTVGGCVQKDDMAALVPEIIKAYAVILATPVYYFGMTASLKAVIDRFYDQEAAMRGGRKTAILVTSYNSDAGVAEALISQYRAISGWMQWDIAGEILACGYPTRADIEQTAFPEQAYKLRKEM